MIRSIVLAAAAAGAVAVKDATMLRGAVQAQLNASAFDLFMLVTQWPPSWSVSSTTWTIHGLWPENNDGSYPQNCGGSNFNPSVLNPILNNLNTYWPSYNGASSTFWDHEYTKHGTCATAVLPTEFEFFNTTLALRAATDVGAALKSAGILPSDSNGFTRAAWDAALSSANGYTAFPSCDSSGRLLEAVVCISKSLQVQACPPAVGSYAKCSANTLYIPVSPFAAEAQ